jgi:deoxyribodipyrimidine photo-lyase
MYTLFHASLSTNATGVAGVVAGTKSWYSSPMAQNPRVKMLNAPGTTPPGPVVYWMQSSPRGRYNHALEYAVHLANHRRVPLVVYFVLTPAFPGAYRRHYRFLIQGLQDVRTHLQERGIPFRLLSATLPEGTDQFSRQASSIVTDMGYLRIHRQWRSYLATHTTAPVVQVETNVVVPVETASEKDQWAAATLRPRIHRHWDSFLQPLNTQVYDGAGLSVPESLPLGIPIPDSSQEVEALLDSLKLSDPSPEATSTPFTGGEVAAQATLRSFLSTKLESYDTLRNDPSQDYTSLLSPYLHFGHISPVDIAGQAIEAAEGSEAPGVRAGLEGFLEELIVRRELAMNFCHYNDAYDTWDGLPEWAQTSLMEHSTDDRPMLYSSRQLEQAETEDPYWNACQREMVRSGRMHGYMRMYWGKKILEWTQNPQDALAIAFELNDRYELDGRDPNGYAGVAWCFGKHDRPWVERPIFGKIRYMNANGLRRKFKGIDRYVQRWAE